jgi:hypothetical protein
MLSVDMLSIFYAEYQARYAECHYTEFRHAEWHYADWQCAFSRG